MDAENNIVQYINICTEWGYPLETLDLRLLIKGYLDSLGVDVKRFRNNTPGPEFIRSFLRRHECNIDSKFNENIKRSRAAVSPKIINEYFNDLEMRIQGIPLCNIVNYDATNLVDDPARKRVLVKKTVKYPDKAMNHTKGSTSIMMAASASGDLLPPYVVYKSSRLYSSWCKNGPTGCRYNCTDSGWFDIDTFEDWVRTVAFNYFEDKPGSKILLGDHLATHLTVEIISECEERDIRFIFLPANSSHFTQPLDIAFFSPLNSAWQHILYNWKKTEGCMEYTIPKHIFPSLLNKLMDEIECSSRDNIIAGFEKCGISTIDRNKVLDRLPGTVKSNDNFKGDIDQNVITMFKELRYGTNSSKKSSQKTKLNFRPRRSVANISTAVEEMISDDSMDYVIIQVG